MISNEIKGISNPAPPPTKANTSHGKEDDDFLMDWSKMSMSTLALTMLNASSKNLAAMQSLLEHESKLAAQASQQKNQLRFSKYHQQIDKSIAEQHRARRLARLNNIFHWVISVSEILIGAVKIGCGCLGAVNEFAPGGAEITAGILGMIGSAEEGRALHQKDENQREHFQKIADKEFNGQMACEMLGLLMDGVGLAVIARQAKKLANIAEDALEHDVVQLGDYLGDGVFAQGETLTTRLRTGDIGNSILDELSANRIAQRFQSQMQQARGFSAFLRNYAGPSRGALDIESLESVIETSLTKVEGIARVSGFEDNASLLKTLAKIIVDEMKKACIKDVTHVLVSEKAACNPYITSLLYVPHVLIGLIPPIKESFELGVDYYDKSKIADANYTISNLKVDQNDLKILEQMQLDLIKRDKELLNKFTQQHIEKVKQTNQIIEMQNRSNQSLAAAIIGTQI